MRRGLASRELRGRERLSDRAVNFFANEAENFGHVEVGRNDLGVGDGGDLAAGIEMLSEPGHAGISVGSDAGIVLVVILQRQSVLGVDDPIEVADRLIGQEIRGARREAFSGKLSVGVTPSSQGIRY